MGYESFTDAISASHSATDRIMRGDAGGFKDLYASSVDITLGNPFGGFGQGSQGSSSNSTAPPRTSGTDEPLSSSRSPGRPPMKWHTQWKSNEWRLRSTGVRKRRNLPLGLPPSTAAKRTVGNSFIGMPTRESLDKRRTPFCRPEVGRLRRAASRLWNHRSTA